MVQSATTFDVSMPWCPSLDHGCVLSKARLSTKMGHESHVKGHLGVKLQKCQKNGFY